MPFFDQNPLDKLTLQAEDADAELDLRGVDRDEAMARIARLIESGGQQQSWLIRFDAAGEDGEETLFLPLGRYLLEARRAGRLARCLPTSDGCGYFIAFDAPTGP